MPRFARTAPRPGPPRLRAPALRHIGLFCAVRRVLGHHRHVPACADLIPLIETLIFPLYPRPNYNCKVHITFVLIGVTFVKIALSGY